MRKIDDFICENTSCEKHEEKVERFHDGEIQYCEECAVPMSKCIGGYRSKHISWSTWRV